MVRNIVKSAMQDVIRKQIARTPSNQAVTTYLSGSLEGEFVREKGNCASLWTHARNAMQHLEKQIDMDMVQGTSGAGCSGVTGDKYRAHNHHSES